MDREAWRAEIHGTESQRVGHDWATELNWNSGVSDGKVSASNAGDPGSLLVWENPLEKEMATHSSTFAWKTLWLEEPGRLQSMGSQSIGHDWETSFSLYFQTLVEVMKMFFITSFITSTIENLS